jgi:hypothetical protein
LLDSLGYGRLRPSLGDTVTLRGTSFSWHTGITTHPCCSTRSV